MGYGWMAGLGQAMQQVGSEQIPQYLARRRQEQQDREAAAQRAVQNALAERQAKAQEDQVQISRDTLTANTDHMKRVDDLAELGHIYERVVPELAGTRLGADDPIRAKLTGAGLGGLIGADGTLGLPFRMDLQKRQTEADIDYRHKAGAAAMENAATNRTWRQQQTATQEGLEAQRFGALMDVPEGPFTKSLGERVKNPLEGTTAGGLSTIKNAYRDARDQDTLERVRMYEVLESMGKLPKGTTETFKRINGDAIQRALSGGGGGRRQIGLEEAFGAPAPPKKQ